MKRFLTILLTTLALTGVLCVSASASSFDGAAKELSAIGMFRGTASGFDLDNAPTRGQAAIMLVRLFGAETEAQNTYRSGRITCPFTDVNETVAPYAAWLADEGLAAGITETTFGASEPCTAKAYTIFLLRALGYKDRTDFTTNNAEQVAQGLGLLDTSAFTGTFLRDDLAAMTYQALGMDLKDGSTYLLDYLIQEAGINAVNAKPMVEKIEACRAINQASKALNEGLSASLEMKMNTTVSNTPAGQTGAAGQIENTAVTVKGDITAVMDKVPEMAMDLTTTVDGTSENVKMWIRDGWLYAQSGETSTKTNMGDSYDALQSMMPSDPSKASGVAILPFLEDVKEKTSGGQTTYTLEMNGALEGMINGLLAQILKETGVPGDALGEIDVRYMNLAYNIMNNGTLKSVTGDMGLSMNMPGSDGSTTGIGMTAEMEMTIKSSGSVVKIKFPDFSDFEEVIGGADGPIAIITTAV